jgi:hypothetical protein
LKGFQIFSGQIFSGRFFFLDLELSAFCGCLLQVCRQESMRSRSCKRGITFVIAAISRIGKGMTCRIPMRCHQIAFASLGKVFLKSADYLWIDGFIQSAKMPKKRRIQFLQTVSIGFASLNSFGLGFGFVTIAGTDPLNKSMAIA